MTPFQAIGVSAGHAEHLVGVEDAGDDAGHPQDRHDREQPAAERDHQLGGHVVLAEHQQRHQPRRQQDEQRRRSRPAPRPAVHSTIPATRHASRSSPRSRSSTNTGTKAPADRVVCDDAAHQVGDVEGDVERRQRRPGAEDAGGDALANDAGDPREGGSCAERGGGGCQAAAAVCHWRGSLPTAVCYHFATPVRPGAFLWPTPSNRRSGSGSLPGSGWRTCATRRRSRRCSGACGPPSTARTPSRSATPTGRLTVLLDRAAARHAIHRNQAARKKSQAARMVSGAKTAA